MRKVDFVSKSDVELKKEIMLEREIEINDINKKSQKLKEIMESLSTMVREQGETVNEIAKTTKKSMVYTEKGHNEIIQAEETTNDKWNCVIS